MIKGHNNMAPDSAPALWKIDWGYENALGNKGQPRRIGVRFCETSDWSKMLEVWLKMTADVYLMIGREVVNVGRISFTYSDAPTSRSILWKMQFNSIDRQRPTQIWSVEIFDAPGEKKEDRVAKMTRYIRRWCELNWSKVEITRDDVRLGFSKRQY